MTGCTSRSSRNSCLALRDPDFVCFAGIHRPTLLRSALTDVFGASRSPSFDQRRRPEALRTAMATAFFCPTRTTSRLPRVTPQLAWICRADGHFIWFNRRVYEYTGATPEQLEGSGWGSVLDPQALPKVAELWRHSLATGDPFVEMEIPIRGADGRFRPFLARTIPVKDDEGRVKLWFGTGTDISELREREKALARQARLIDLAPAATFVRQKHDGTITFWSQGAERLYCWTRREEALGRRTNDSAAHRVSRTTGKHRRQAQGRRRLVWRTPAIYTRRPTDNGGKLLAGRMQHPREGGRTIGIEYRHHRTQATCKNICRRKLTRGPPACVRPWPTLNTCPTAWFTICAPRCVPCTALPTFWRRNAPVAGILRRRAILQHIQEILQAAWTASSPMPSITAGWRARSCR